MPSDSLKPWVKCVQQAKVANGKSKDSYGFVQGQVLKDARRCYCALTV